MTGWLKKYDDIVVRNGPAIAQLEQTLQSVRYLLPGRLLTDSNWDLVASELLQSVLTLLRAYHDGIYHRHFPNATSSDIPLYDNNADKTTRTLMWLLNWLSATQVPVEMLVERFLALQSPPLSNVPGRTGTVCVVIESIKAVARLTLWARRNFCGRMPRAFLPAGIVRPVDKIAADEELLSTMEEENVPPMQRMRLMYQSLKHCCPQRMRDFVDWQLSRDSSAHMESKHGKIDWHELVSIVRPVVTALSFQQQQRLMSMEGRDGKGRWLWWLLNLTVELWAVYPDLHAFLQQHTRLLAPGAAGVHVEEGEDEERLARLVSVLLNVLREPMYSSGPRQVISSVATFLSAWTLLRPVGTSLDAYRRLIEDVYFATSHS